MASGNSLRPWNLTKGKHKPPSRPGPDLGSIGAIWDWFTFHTPRSLNLPTSDEIDTWLDDHLLSGRDPKRPKK